MTTDDFLKQAARQLPVGWQMRVVVERNAGWVDLINPEGDEIELSPDPLIEGGFPAAVANALDIAMVLEVEAKSDTHTEVS